MDPDSHAPPARSLPTLALLGTSFLLPVASTTALFAPAWSLRAAIALSLTPLGLVMLPRLVRRERIALLAIAFAAVATLSTALSDNPTVALVGHYALGTGLLFILALLGFWALGASRGDGFGHDLSSVLLLVSLISGALAVLQATTDLNRLGLGLFDQRSAALLGNPVQLTALLAGAAGLIEHRFRRAPLAWAAGVVLIATALQVSGSRFVPLFGVPALALTIAVRRDLRAVVFALLLGLGYLVPQTVPGFDSLSATTRIASETAGGVGGSSTEARIFGWAAGYQAFTERPVVGHGPGRYLEAATPHRSLQLARIGPDSYFADAHNLVVEYTVTTGLPGGILFSLWVAASMWFGRRSPLVAFAAGVLLVQLVQPQAVSTTPLAFAALGAALARGAPVTLGRLPSVASLALVITAASVGGRFVAADAQIRSAQLNADPEQGARALEAMPPWYSPTSAVTRLFIFEATVQRRPPERFEPEAFGRAVVLAERLVEATPEDPRGWNLLGSLQLQDGDPRAAERSFTRAEQLAPWSEKALEGLRRARAARDGDTAVVERRLDQVREG